MKKKILIIILVALPFLVIFFTNYTIANFSEGKTFSDVSKIENNKVGLVLGTSNYLVGGGVNPYFKYRVDAAVKLFKHGKINFILVSGDNALKNYNEPIQFQKALIKHGIPKDKIFLDYAGFRTLDSVVRAKKIFGQDSITIISQKFHNERAIYLAENNGLHAVGFNAKDVSASSGFKTNLREYFAKTKAYFDVLFGVGPKFLGEQIVIE